MIELAENVAGGAASNIVMGATLTETSFMIGDCLRDEPGLPSPSRRSARRVPWTP